MDQVDNPYASPREPDPLPTEWVGEYRYDPNYEVQFDLIPVSFRMSWVRKDNGKIKGTVNDGPESAMQETGTISGFFRKGEIEFAKYMPVETHFNFDGSAIRSNRRHPAINYFGKYDCSTKTLEGVWYITQSNETDGWSGTWSAVPDVAEK